ncbi:MAG TPA: endoglucanase [Hungateiclostridium thermocellum]|uniref:Endoglucanase D n=1 Tax=Acetivibrio thermocellus (strain ATCC 27405 / DSM 1237 / JCM 9322 / NBRC 103400 / NCIMB 10682 / NRRL B-4536 / VPI 7372) TaxID=203119 RepID=GUND_ACET2|nr:glycoside hydrolase family 9 protein [Acetivibrio thermocellus]A3DDN1.1 RecName: Full=Endoglucanase D; Short=EGD; AltName: Full=Cellulase D; AltName: Full=Endo-1,4-beta-glucanase; Flags: Precursor [Acetivibrio thermocellus ATCC 27405]ABN52060.1 glycoside hydrolase family 9 [Acetivibrio thermocellus ATCC 27405]HBW28399.1 endoglucanase [Acetivibrio thermocellus]HOP93892.1 glycoside hydrolase family 9 protein [Acetivibrio thermocellus]
MSRMTLKSSMKKRVLSLLIAVVFLSLTGVFPSGLIETKVSAAKITENYQFDSRIRLNSIGFIPNHSKKATIAANCSTFYVVKEDGTIVYTGTATSMFDNDTKETVYIADFSSVNEEGTYYLAVPGVGKSVNFKIAMNVYEDAFKTAMLGMYLLRCGTSVSATYNGIHYSHGPCHTNDAYLDYINGQHTKKDSTKGWHDAGDYNKYVVNAGITVGSMFLAWEHFKDQLEPVALEIPEKNNSIPDFLDELKYEIDWILTMQYPDGSGRVAHKVSTRNFGGFIMPENEHDERFFVPWSSAATADFVAMTAMAARIFRPYDPQYAEKCINAAKVSYEFLKNNPANVFANQSGFSTGEYATVSDADDRLWAAAEMWETLGDEEYLRDFENRAAQFSKKIEADFDWDNVANLGMFTYLLSERPGKNPALVQSIKDSLLSTADSIVRTSQNHGYGRTLGTTYYWGCNGTVVRQTMILQVANKISPNNDYVNAALDAISHVFGRNYYNRSYVTGLGINPPMNPHDRRSGADGIWEPWPGYLVGGGWPGPKDWVDIQDSYQTNEIAINWNAALIYALAGFVNYNSAQNEVLYGDVNDDGKVNSTDLTLLKRYVLKAVSTLPSSKAEKNADVNRDGRVNSSDVTILSRYLIRVIEKLPI